MLPCGGRRVFQTRRRQDACVPRLCFKCKVMKDCDECVAGCKAIYHMDVEKVESLGEGLLVISSLNPTFTLENEFLCLSAA